MSVSTSFTALVATVNAYKGSWGESQLVWNEETNVYMISRNDAQLAWDVDMFLWATYDPRDNFIYPNIKHWDDLLEQTIEDGSYSQLNKDEVLSILFGLHHRNRVSDGLWCMMFTEGVTQKLLGRLLVLESE